MFIFAGFPRRFVLWPDRALWGRGRTAEVKGRGRVPKRTERRKCGRQKTETMWRAMNVKRPRDGDKETEEKHKGERRGMDTEKNNGDQEQEGQREDKGKRGR